ncbi:MAG: ABC transporter ATP-binding protein [Desulfobacterales bacterium]|nr:MAG: ABC transporter ATP-binding protein [Desulfobacterales bacterium]
MAKVTIKNLYKRYGKVEAVKGINLECEDKEFLCLLGPSGCGKSSTLRMIAGLEDITSGEITIDGVRVNNIHPSKRDIAMVFETYALYPHKTVFKNMSYPLRIRKLSKSEILTRVQRAAEILEITDLMDRYPRELSGGQKQRVAIGRAIVRNPKVFLMDEPISHLDAKLRAHMRGELKHLQKELSQTFIYVTHDQLEAMSMADRIAVMNHGLLQQYDSPHNIFNQPANQFVAGFVGDPPMNFIECILTVEDGWKLKHDEFELSLEDKVQQKVQAQTPQFSGALNVTLGIRPESITIKREKTKPNEIAGQVYITEPLGSDLIVDVTVGQERLKIKTTSSFEGDRGAKVFLEMVPDKIHLFDAQTSKSLM